VLTTRVEVESTDSVTAATRRLAESGLDTRTEENVACCYAAQDKVWVHGPGKEPWEVYVTGDAPNWPGRTSTSLRGRCDSGV
jgi:hypothetical protein